MIFLAYVLLSVYILSVNFYAFRLIKTQYDDFTENGDLFARQDGKLFLAAILGGATAIYASMFVLKFRLGNLLLMIGMPVLAVLNLYCFYLGYRGISGIIL